MNQPNNDTCCPLCGNNHLYDFHKDRNRSYFQCLHCLLVFVPSEFRLSAEDEKSEYDLHNNDPDDQGYRKFLSRLSTPLMEKLVSHSRGLDFGCGPGPALSVMLEESGHKMELYDPFFFDNRHVLKQKYDFITMTEVAEHLSRPGEVFSQLFHMLKSPGYLGIMTKMVADKAAFKNWHYTHDPTHICFFSRESFEYLAEIYSAGIEFTGSDVIIFKIS